ncbi:MAG: hypothetical protein AAF433_22375 [Bacteroidota bacterium]
MRNFLLLTTLSLFFFGCPSDDDMPPTPLCGDLIQIVEEIPPVADIPQNIEASVDGLCLSITIGHSGCSPEPWTMELFTLGDIAESIPTQSQAYFVFNDAAPGESQACLAFFTETFEFDLTPYLADALPSTLRIGDTEIELLVE